MNKMNLPTPFGPSQIEIELPRETEGERETKRKRPTEYMAREKPTDEEDAELDERDINPQKKPRIEKEQQVELIKTLTPAQIAQLPKENLSLLPEDFKKIEEANRNVVPLEQLNANKMCLEDIQKIEKFKTHTPGEPTPKLYLKNIAKTVTNADIEYIYFRYFKTDEEAKSNLDINLMQQGKMRGQAFVTFPTVEQAKQALEETHGYLLHEKPLIVAFGKMKK